MLLGGSRYVCKTIFDDTNVIRYKVNIDANIKKHARFFWKKVITEIQNGEAVIYVPDEVKRELEIQSFGFIVHGNEKELRNIAELLEFSNEIPVLNSIEM